MHRYQVQPGDSAASIAARFTGNPARAKELVHANMAQKPAAMVGREMIFRDLHVGESLNIPKSWESGLGAVPRAASHTTYSGLTDDTRVQGLLSSYCPWMYWTYSNPPGQRPCPYGIQCYNGPLTPTEYVGDFYVHAKFLPAQVGYVLKLEPEEIVIARIINGRGFTFFSVIAEQRYEASFVCFHKMSERTLPGVGAVDNSACLPLPGESTMQPGQPGHGCFTGGENGYESLYFGLPIGELQASEEGGVRPHFLNVMTPCAPPVPPPPGFDCREWQPWIYGVAGGVGQADEPLDGEGLGQATSPKSSATPVIVGLVSLAAGVGLAYFITRPKRRR